MHEQLVQLLPHLGLVELFQSGLSLTDFIFAQDVPSPGNPPAPPPPPAPPGGSGDWMFSRVDISFADILKMVRTQMSVVWGNMHTGNMIILCVCLIASLTKYWLDTVIQHDLVGWVAKAFNTLLLGVILAFAIENMERIDALAWDGAGLVMHMFAGGGEIPSGTGALNGLDILGSKLWDSALATLGLIFKGTFAPLNVACTGEPIHKYMICQGAKVIGLAGSFIVNLSGIPLFFLIIGTILALIFFFNVTLSLIRGVVVMITSLLLLPFTLAVYPINDDWAKKCIGHLFGAFAQMAIVAFFASLYASVITQFVDQMTRSTPYIGFVDTVNSGMTVMIGSLLLIVMMILLSATVHTASNIAMQVFGTFAGLKGLMGGSGKGGQALSNAMKGGGGGGPGGGGGGGGGGGPAAGVAKGGAGAGGAGAGGAGAGGAGAGGAGAAAGGAGAVVAGAALAPLAAIAGGVMAAKAAEKKIQENAG